MEKKLGKVIGPKGDDGLGIMYPGYKYVSKDFTSPAELYGGVWEYQTYHEFQGMHVWIKQEDDVEI